MKMNMELLYIYAQVLHEIFKDQVCYGSSQDTIRQIMQRGVLITIGQDKQKSVSVLDIFKFLLNNESTRVLSVSIYDGPSPFKNYEHTGGKESIRDAIKAAWHLPKKQLNKAIKRLFLQYHPDKNPNNPNAKDEFQYLMQEINLMETGIPEDQIDGHEEDIFRSEWSSHFKQWNQTVFSQNRFTGRSTSSAGRIPGG